MVLVRDMEDSDTVKNAFELRYKKTEEKIKHYIFCAATHQERTLWLNSLARVADSNLRHHRSISNAEVSSETPPIPVRLSEDQRTESISKKRRPLPNVPKPPPSVLQNPQVVITNAATTSPGATSRNSPSASFTEPRPAIPVKKTLTVDTTSDKPHKVTSNINTNSSSANTNTSGPGKLPKPPMAYDEKVPAPPKKPKPTEIFNSDGSTQNETIDGTTSKVISTAKRNSLDSENAEKYSQQSRNSLTEIPSKNSPTDRKLPTPIKLQTDKK